MFEPGLFMYYNTYISASTKIPVCVYVCVMYVKYFIYIYIIYMFMHVYIYVYMFICIIQIDRVDRQIDR